MHPDGWNVANRTIWVLLLSTAVSAAQTQANDKGGPPQSCSHRSIPVAVVRNDDGRELRPAQLQITVEGTNATVLSFERANIAPRVALLLDTSSSMARFSGAAWENEWSVAELVLDALPQHSQVAVVTFGEDVRVSGFDSKQAAGQTLVQTSAMKAHGRTPLYSAVEQSLRLFAAPQFGDAIFIVSDAGDNVGTAKRKALSSELVSRGIRCFVILLRLHNEALTPEERQGGPNLADIAKSSGGTIWALAPKWPSGQERSDFVARLQGQIGMPYRLDVSLAASPAKPAKLKIASALNGLELAYPQQIETCSSERPISKP